MKKHVFIYILLLIVLIVCNKSENLSKNIEDEITAFDNSTAVMGLETQTDYWIDAYYYVMENKIFSSEYLYLVDIDFDGVPEMFTTCSDTDGTWINHGFSFKDSNILEIQFAEPIFTSLKLYKDIKTNRLVWIVSGRMKDSNSYHYIWQQIDFSDFCEVEKSTFFEWREIRKEITDDVSSYYSVEYQLIDYDSNVVVTTKEEIEAQFEKAFSQYEPMEALTLLTSSIEFINEKNFYDYDLFYSFMQLYDTTTWQNTLSKSKDVFDLPIYFISNENFYNNAQFSDSQLSLITKGYSRIDKNTKTNIHINYIEFNRYYEENIQFKWNHRLKEWAFFDWNVLREKEIILDILLIPTFYKDYLSIQKMTYCNMEGTSHPWNSLSAKTIDIKTGEEIRLTDILVIDDRIKEKIYAGEFINDRFSKETCIEYGLYEQLYKVILNATDNTKDYQNNVFFLTESGVVFIIDVLHIMGDYLKFEISYRDLEEIWCGIK